MAKKIKIEEYEKNHGISKKAKIADKIKLISLIIHDVLKLKSWVIKYLKTSMKMK